MKILIVTLLVCFSSFSQATDIKITTSIYHSEEQVFHKYKGPGRFDSFLAMNIIYKPIDKIRAQLNSALGIKLDYLKKMNPNGEAHITVISPIEFYDVLKEKLTIEEINKIATRYQIQNSRISLFGIGSANKKINGKDLKTFFLISESENLRFIRQQIYREFTRRGGKKNIFDPSWFFPHITIGYIGRDLHESDGVLKNLKFSHNKQFNLKFIYK